MAIGAGVAALVSINGEEILTTVLILTLLTDSCDEPLPVAKYVRNDIGIPCDAWVALAWSGKAHLLDSLFGGEELSAMCTMSAEAASENPVPLANRVCNGAASAPL
jgi:hypothetical protein